MIDDSVGCHVLHVDMDAFFALVAIRDRPELAEVPVIVGGGDRSVVLSANYPARALGISSAMPMTRARRICPEAVVLPPRYEDFESVSASVMELFRQITPVVEPLSLDEAFLDVSGAGRRWKNPWGTPREMAEHIRARVADEQRITCSVGVANAMSVAKLASRRAKPDGVIVVPQSRVTGFLHPLDVGELYGVGEKTRERLHRLGLISVGDVAHTPVATLQRIVGAAGAHLHDLAWGTDRRPVVATRGVHEPDHSMGADQTFARDVDDPEVCRRELLRLSARVGSRMRAAGVAGRTICIRVRFADFTTITRSRTLPDGTDVTAEIHAAAVRLFDRLGLQRARIRLVGVRVEGLRPRESMHRQLVLGSRAHGWPEADRAVDRAARRFGRNVVVPASLLTENRSALPNPSAET